MMIISSILLMAITGGFLYYALFMKNTDRYTRLEDIYREKYHRDEAKLASALAAGEIDQATYDTEVTLLGRDLLAVAADGKPANASVRWSLIVGMLILALIGLATFWSYGYRPLDQTLDQDRMELAPIVEKWVNSLHLDDLRGDFSIVELNPPKEVLEASNETFMALNMLSSRENHRNLKYLYLLGDLYYQRALFFMEDPKTQGFGKSQLQIANDLYINLYEQEEQRYKPYANNMFLYMQLALNDFVLNERLEYSYDRLMQMNPDNDSMKLQYVYILVENQKFEKALFFVEHLKRSYSGEGDERSLQALTLVGEQIERFKAAQDAIYRVKAQFTLDESMDNLPSTAILYLYLREPDRPTGPPLAAKKVPLKSPEWPLNVEVTDEAILMESGKGLEDYETLIISARISLSGDPLPQHGDIETTPKKVERGEVTHLHFDHRVIKE